MNIASGHRATGGYTTNFGLHKNFFVGDFVKDRSDILKILKEEKKLERVRGFNYKPFWDFCSQSPIPTILLRKDGEIVKYNDAMAELTGYTHDEIPDFNAWMLKIYPNAEYRNNVIEISQRSQQKENDVKRNELIITRKDGEQRRVKFFAYDIQDKEKSTDLEVIQVKDLTESKRAEERISELTATNKQLRQETIERKKAEEKLKKAFKKLQTQEKHLEAINEHLDSFAYSVSHDLRAPLRAIDGFSQVLLDMYRDKVDDEMQHYLDRISKGAQKMGQLIDDLLGFSRATRGEIKYKKIDVEKIVNDLVKAHRDVIEQDRDIEFIVNPLGEVEADEQMLKIVFTNLLQNAVKYTRKCEKARIEIESKQKRGEIQFFVKDNGIGFDMKYKDKLFEAFQRLHTDKEFTGSGIGLATVKRIVSKHGGKVWAEGEVDKGATFYFTLPAKK